MYIYSMAVLLCYTWICIHASSFQSLRIRALFFKGPLEELFAVKEKNPIERARGTYVDDFERVAARARGEKRKYKDVLQGSKIIYRTVLFY